MAIAPKKRPESESPELSQKRIRTNNPNRQRPHLDLLSNQETVADAARNKSTDLAPALDVLEKLHSTLVDFLPGCDILIAMGDPRGTEAHVQWASGAFSPSLGHDLNPIEGTWKQMWSGVSEIKCKEASALAQEEPQLGTMPDGQIALLRLDLGSSLTALIAVLQPHAEGPIAKERLDALRQLAELTRLAAGAFGVSQEMETQEIRLNLLRGEIEELQQFYRHYAEAIRQCFWVLDLDAGRALAVSDNFERVWGTSRQCLSDGLTGFMRNVHPFDRDKVLSDFHTSLDATLDTEFRVLDEEGEIKWIWLRGFPKPTIDADASARQLVLIADDITEKKSQEELIRSREVELASNARIMAVGDLANGVAHEINNPLTVIVGKAAEIRTRAEKGKATPQDVMEAAEKIQKTSLRIADIVLSLKALSRPDKKPLMHTMAVSKIFQDLRDTCWEKFKARQVVLELPEVSPELTVEMNPTLVSQMIFNLINNALDAVQKENEKWVRVEHAEDEDSLYLYVTDSGPGIPIKIRSRIFDPFFTTKGPDKGTGLGLSLAAGIAARHNGSVRLDTMHKYTRFVIQLPKKQPPHAD